MIALDVTPCCGQATGVGRYVNDLSHGLSTQTPILAVYQGHHGTPPATVLASASAHARYDFLGGRIGARLRLGKILKRHNCTLYHSTSTIAVPGPGWNGAVVTTIHDCHALDSDQVVSKRTKRLFQSLFASAMQRSHLIITPSAHTAEAVRAHGWSGLIRIIPHGIASAKTVLRPAAAPNVPYLLTLGAIAPNKGLSTLAHAKLQLPSLPWFHLGPIRYDPGQHIQKDMHKVGCQLLGYLNDQEREQWLAHAWVLCQPSSAEGFGYPPLEAMAHGIPVIARRAGALPEVLADAAMWVADDNPIAFAQALTDLRDHPQRHGQLAQQARRRAEEFTLKRMINEHQSAYQAAHEVAHSCA